MDLNPNVLMELALMRNQETLVAAQRGRLARSAALERYSPPERPQDGRPAETAIASVVPVAMNGRHRSHMP
jgi:hypothetical protein